MRKGFTLIEVLVVAAETSWLGSPWESRFQSTDLGPREKCSSTNLGSIGLTTEMDHRVSCLYTLRWDR
jgi:hypothetical protein